MGWTTSLRRDPDFGTYEQHGLGQGKGMIFDDDGVDKEILQLELLKLLSCLEEMMERGWLEPEALAKWIKRHLKKKEKWKEPTEEEVGKWGEPKWRKPEPKEWEEPKDEKWGEPDDEKWG